jgi:uncharacterized protein (UPF0261 family)
MAADELSRGRVALVGTLDTKRTEAEYFREQLLDAGLDVTLVDVGSPMAGVTAADISASAVARAVGVSMDGFTGFSSRSEALSVMSDGAARILRDLVDEGKVHGVAGFGGSGGTSAVSSAMRALPLWLPKVLVSTVASGDTRPYVGTSDVLLVPSIVDIAGLNRISERVFRRAAAMVAGLVGDYRRPRAQRREAPLLAATMFGVTTPCVDAARRELEGRGYEVLVFHATGVGGQQMEALAATSELDLVLDVTTTELADEVAGGIFSAGPDRLTSAGRRGIPQVVSLGALDMVNFGPLDSVPAHYRSRRLHEHNSAVTLMRTSAEECAAIGRLMAERLNGSAGPVSVLIPTEGLSELSRPGGPFHDAAADEALRESLIGGLRQGIDVQALDCNINDVEFAAALVAAVESYAPASGSARLAPQRSGVARAGDRARSTGGDQ